MLLVKFFIDFYSTIYPQNKFFDKVLKVIDEVNELLIKFSLNIYVKSPDSTC
jgi:hypothetical protein